MDILLCIKLIVHFSVQANELYCFDFNYSTALILIMNDELESINSKIKGLTVVLIENPLVKMFHWNYPVADISILFDW